MEKQSKQVRKSRTYVKVQTAGNRVIGKLDLTEKGIPKAFSQFTRKESFFQHIQ